MAAHISLIRHFLLVAWRKFISDNGLFLATGLAFNLLLYSIPFTLLLISLLSYTVSDSDRAMKEVDAILRDLLPRSQEAFVDTIAMVVANRERLGLVGFISLAVFSSFLFGSIRVVLNQVFGVRIRRTYFRGLAADFLLMVMTAALAILAIATAWVATSVAMVVGQFHAWVFLVEPIVLIMNKIIRLILTASVFYMAYRFSPATTVTRRALWMAALTSAMLFELAKQAFAWYVAFAETSPGLYGVLGGLLFFLVWLYYASVVFVLGAEVGWAYDHVRGQSRE